MSTHFKLGPSKAKSWTLCTASIGFIEENRHRLPPSGSRYADEGTEAHDWAAKVLTNTLFVHEVPEAFRPHVEFYAGICRDLITPYSTTYIERSVPLFYAPDGFGTVDFCSATNTEIHIRDLKYGAGVLVESEYNKQLAIYAYSIITDCIDAGMFDWGPQTKVTIQAVQPRHTEWENKPWETTLGELHEFCMNEIAPAAKRILGGEGGLEFYPSDDTCRFCEAKGICPARAAALNAMPSDINPLEHFDDISAPEVETLTDEQLLSCYQHAKRITAFLGDVEKHLFAMAVAGKPLEGTKLVKGRDGNRKWGDVNLADSALAALGLDMKDRYEQSLKSVVQIEKLVKEKGLEADLSTLIYRSPGQTVLALAGDKRPAIESPVDMFDDISESMTDED